MTLPVPAGHCRISLVGTTFSAEIFDTSFWVLGGSESLPELQGMVDAIAAIIKGTGAFDQTLAALVSSGEYTAVRGYAYPNGGTKSTWVAEADLGLAGTGSYHALQQCVVVSLRSTNVGRSNRGRMYLPGCGMGMAASQPLYTAGDVDALATEWQSIFKAVNSIELSGGANPSVVIVSFTNTDSIVCSSIQIDNKPDIQRRRANRLLPDHTAAESIID